MASKLNSIPEMTEREYRNPDNHTWSPGLGIKSQAKSIKVPVDLYETGKLEREVRKDEQKLLKLHKYVSVTVYVGPIPTGPGVMATNPLKGFPDQIVYSLIQGKMFFIELKRNSGGVLSPEQQTWHHDLKRCGQTVVVITSAEMLKRWMITNQYITEV